MPTPGKIVVVSCYELGHQPLAAASTTGFLERAGHRPHGVDLAVESMDRLSDAVSGARLVTISVPMHTAMHIGVRAAERIRQAAPAAHLCFFGLYATLNAEHLLAGIADSVVGGEHEATLVELADALTQGRSADEVLSLALPGRPASPVIDRLDFATPVRDGLPALERYASLVHDGETVPAAAVETSRGCLHLCRHCPIPPVYGGRFFVIPKETVLSDIRWLAGRGVRHVTFADPDFLNGPGHSLAIVRAMHREFPRLTFDFTTKVENILKRRDLLAEFAACGCLFVVSAVESLSDEVLTHLLKGHARSDIFEAFDLTRRAGIALRPSLVAFTPWTRIEDYFELLDWIEREQLFDHVDPVQLSIRLLIPPGSPLARLAAMQPHLGALDAPAFSYRWRHPDARMDRLQVQVSSIVRDAALSEEDARVTVGRIRDAAYAIAGRVPPSGSVLPALSRARPPRLTEPWFC